jgi:SAM-dependent methyltransferase
MDKRTAARLVALNKQFYQTFGREFSATRRRLQPGVKRGLDMLRGDEAILDLGCGNGELARELSRGGFAGTYLGMDFSLPLLQEAGERSANFVFAEADLTAPDWDAKLDTGHWSLVISFATLHHIPGEDLRRELVIKVRRLLKEDGLFVHSNWQFLNSETLRRRIQPWSEAGLTEAEVDPGDYLLDWRSGGRGLRYVHAFDEAELAALAAATGFRVRESFRSDGENGRLGLYQRWEAA